MAEPARKRIHVEGGAPVPKPQVSLRVHQGGGQTSPRKGNLQSVPTGGSVVGGVEEVEETPASGIEAPVRPNLRVIQGGAGVEDDENEEGEDSEKVAESEQDNRTQREGNDSTEDKHTAEKAVLGGAAGSGALREAEKTDPIGGLYKAAGIDQDGVGEGGNKFMRRIKGISRRQKLLSGAGVGGIMSLIIAVLLVTPIYRIPALMGDLESKLGAQVNDIVEARAERIIVNYLISRAGGDSTQYVVEGSPLKSLWKTFQSHRMEKKIYDRTGIKFQKIGKVVHVLHDGRDLGGIRNYDEVMKIINRGTIKTRGDFKIINKSVLSVIQFHKASEEAKSFDNRFLKGKGYSVPKTEDDPAKTAAENAEQKVEALTAQQIDETTGEVLDLFDEAVNCIMDSGDACNQFDEADTENPAPDPNSEEGRRLETNGDLDTVSGEMKEAEEGAKKEALKDRAHGFMNRMIEALLKKVIGAAAAKVAVDAIPYLGWVDLGATLQHAFGDALKNHLAERIPVMMKQSAYGAIFSAWEGYGHETKAGKVPLPMVAALQQQLGDANKSQAHHVLYKGDNGGVPITPKVGDNLDFKILDIMDEVYNSFGVHYVLRGPLELWYYTVGKLLKLIGDVGANIVTWLLKISGFTALMDHTMKAIFGDDWQVEFGKFMVKTIMRLFGIAIDPLARGAEMLNNLFAGAAAALNWYCHYNIGCRILTPLQTVITAQNLDKKQQADMALTPLKDRLFSPDMPNSLTATLIRDAPASSGPGGFMAALAKQVAALPSSVMRAFSPDARAADYINYSKAAGVRWYGATPDDLKQDTAVELRQQSGDIESIQCPKVNPSAGFNACMADKAVMKSMACGTAAEECKDWNQTAPATQ